MSATTMKSRVRLPGILALIWTVAAGCVVHSEDNLLKAPHSVRGYQTGQSYFYVVPVDDGVVLVDTGGEEDGATLLSVLDTQKVKAILLTHSHNDHVAAAHLFDVPVYLGPGEAAYIRGEKEFGGFIQNLFGRPKVTAPEPAQLVEVEDREVLSLGGAIFIGIHLPGHTDGSMAWLFQDVLFGGDAVFGGDALAPAPGVFSDDPEKAEASMEKLRGYSFNTLLDGHNGMTEDAFDKLP
jgi:glyoxylase-like metal-dependent hydrolase (beta-lactamase superfamily II)